MPAADLSEQISTAGTEASGTGNMKLAMNGALTIGTDDGANIEIRQNVGDDNIFIFGLKTPEVVASAQRWLPADAHLRRKPALKAVLDAIAGGTFSPEEPSAICRWWIRCSDGDHYLLLADFAAYVAAQARVDALYCDRTPGPARRSPTWPAWARSPPTAPSAIRHDIWGHGCQGLDAGIGTHAARQAATRSSAICQGRHGDPSRFSAAPRDRPWRLRGCAPSARRGLGAGRGRRPGPGRCKQRSTQGFFEGAVARQRSVPLRVRWHVGSETRSSKTPTASRRCWARWTSGCWPKARICVLTNASAPRCARSTASPAPPLPSGRRMPSASAWLAISTIWDGRRHPMRCAANVACGNSFCPACRRRLLQIRDAGRRRARAAAQGRPYAFCRRAAPVDGQRRAAMPPVAPHAVTERRQPSAGCRRSHLRSAPQLMAAYRGGRLVPDWQRLSETLIPYVVGPGLHPP